MKITCAGLVTAMMLAGGVWAADEADPRTVTVSGEGIRTVEPEYAEVVFEVEIVRPDPVAAKAEADAVFAKLVRVFAGLKIKDEDINTTRVEVHPKYNYEKDTMVFKGYEVARRAKVTLRKLDDLEGLLKEAVESGVNYVCSVELCHSRRDELKKEAQKTACARAKENAAFLASQFGAELGPIRRVVPSEPYHRGEFVSMAVSPKPESTFKMGRIEIRAEVEAVFDLVPRK